MMEDTKICYRRIAEGVGDDSLTLFANEQELKYTGFIIGWGLSWKSYSLYSSSGEYLILDKRSLEEKSNCMNYFFSNHNFESVILNFYEGHEVKTDEKETLMSQLVFIANEEPQAEENVKHGRSSSYRQIFLSFPKSKCILYFFREKQPSGRMILFDEKNQRVAGWIETCSELIKIIEKKRFHSSDLVYKFCIEDSKKEQSGIPEHTILFQERFELKQEYVFAEHALYAAFDVGSDLFRFAPVYLPPKVE